MMSSDILRFIARAVLGAIGAGIGLTGGAAAQEIDILQFCRETLVAASNDPYCTGYMEGYSRGVSSSGPGTYAAFGPMFVVPGQGGGAMSGAEGAGGQPLFYVPTNPLAPGTSSAGLPAQYLYKPYTLDEFAGSNLAKQYGVKDLDQQDWSTLLKTYRAGGLGALEGVLPQVAIEGIEGGIGGQRDLGVLLIPPQPAT